MYNNKITTTMKIRRIQPKVARQRAIQIAANHNCVSLDIAQRYTDNELKEVLKQLNLKAAF